MIVDVVNTVKGFGYDEDGEPVVLDGDVWREALGGFVKDGVLHVQVQRKQRRFGFVEIPLARDKASA